MRTPLNIAIAGANGRMGQAIIGAIEADAGMTFVGGLSRETAGTRTCNNRSDLIAAADVILDFSTGTSAASLAQVCAERGGPALVIGATGFEPDDLAAIADAGRRIPLVRSGNFSVGVNMLTGLVAQVARRFPAERWDIEVLEAHHRRKVDAPSGTALMLGEAAASGRGVSLSTVERRGRDGVTDARPTGEIGFAVMRGGGIVGEHSVIFASDEEVVTLAHSALDRGMFARGALLAARWIVDQAPGEYDMHDVLGMSASI